MDSLRQLNTYSTGSDIEYIDYRPSVYTFSSLSNQSKTTFENQPFTAPEGVNLTFLSSRTEDLTFSINVAGLSGTTVSWGNLSGIGTGSLVSNNVGSTYTVYGIKSVGDWNLIKNPTVTMPVNPPDNWIYNSTLTYYQGNTKSWTTSVVVNQLDELSTPSDFYYPNLSTVITGTPQVVELSNTAIKRTNWTVTVNSTNTNSFGNLSSASALGGTSTFIANVLTISGNTLQVNSHLANITYAPPNNLDLSWQAVYSTYNSITGFTSTVSQLMRSQETVYLSYTTPAYYAKNQTTLVAGQPSITDTISNTSGTYRMRITNSDLTAYGNLATVSTLGGTSTFYANKALVITGNKSQVNSHLANLQYTSATDYQNDFILSYVLTVPTGNVAGRIQNFYVGDTTLISNTNINRSYISNTSDQTIFANTTPQIIEVVNPAPTYTVSVVSTAGLFGLSNTATSSSFSYTGSKNQVNATMANIRFYPTRNVSGSQTLTFNVFRGAQQILSQTNGLLGTDRSTSITQFISNITTSGQITLTYDQAFYGNANIVAIGGGGGGAAGNSTGGGGGGAGGDITFWSNIQLNDISPNVTIGIGGLGAYFPLGASPTDGQSGGATSLTTTARSFVANGGGGGSKRSFWYNSTYSPYNLKGTVSTPANLPSVASTYDAYYVTSTGTYYYRNVSIWQNTGTNAPYYGFDKSFGGNNSSYFGGLGTTTYQNLGNGVGVGQGRTSGGGAGAGGNGAVATSTISSGGGAGGAGIQIYSNSKTYSTGGYGGPGPYTGSYNRTSNPNPGDGGHGGEGAAGSGSNLQNGLSGNNGLIWIKIT